MTPSPVRQSGRKLIPVVEAKEVVLTRIAAGDSVGEACQAAGRSKHTYIAWMRDDPVFHDKVDRLRDARQAMSVDGRQTVVPDFEEFCREWIGEEPFPLHMRMIDVIEGREPREMHPTMVYEPGSDRMVCINIPPNHGKTSHVTTNYVVWRIHKDPSISVLIISKSREFAKTILWDIKRLLTDSQYREMHLRFAPDGPNGVKTWESKDDPWTADAIYVNGKTASEGSEKDPTVQVLGIKGQIYGRRASLIILDDAVDETNVNDFEAQKRWLMKTVRSRLPPRTGQLVLVGTRMGSTDLYSTMRDIPNEYAEPGEPDSLFTYFSQPAVLDYGSGGVDTWVPLWPETYKDGVLVPRFTGRDLAAARSAVGERDWSLVYQQQDAPEDATFNEEAVRMSVNGLRFPGPMVRGGIGHRHDGQDGLYVIGGLDPASVGHTAFVVVGLDKNNINSEGRVVPKRYVLDGANVEGMPLPDLQAKLRSLTEAHGINEWVIERNAAQLFLLQDKVLNDWMRQRGVRMTPHNTNLNKLDHDFGVMGLAPLFETARVLSSGSTLLPGKMKRAKFEDMSIELPDHKQNPWVSALITQLVNWQPSGMKVRQKTDLVMALWFTEIAIQRLLGLGRNRATHLKTRWSTPAQLAGQRSVDLREVRQLQGARTA